jgi:hypothetical protein
MEKPPHDERPFDAKRIEEDFAGRQKSASILSASEGHDQAQTEQRRLDDLLRKYLPPEMLAARLRTEPTGIVDPEPTKLPRAGGGPALANAGPKQVPQLQLPGRRELSAIEAEHDLRIRLDAIETLDEAADEVLNYAARMLDMRRPTRAFEKSGRETRRHCNWRYALRSELRTRAFRRGDDLRWWE